MTNHEKKNNKENHGKGNKSEADEKNNSTEQNNNAHGAENIENDIRSAEEDAKSQQDKLLRVMAEFDNFKKRMSREREELIRYGNENLLKDLLPSLDDLDRVLDHISPDAPDDVKKIAEGVELVRKTLQAALAKYDLKEVESEGKPFDPALHEAIAVVESDTCPANTVMAVHRKGYVLSGRLIRPAMVTVSKA